VAASCFALPFIDAGVMQVRAAARGGVGRTGLDSLPAVRSRADVLAVEVVW
jgi:hypothetical protein